jgi:hypothetical protein
VYSPGANLVLHRQLERDVVSSGNECAITCMMCGSEWEGECVKRTVDRLLDVHTPGRPSNSLLLFLFPNRLPFPQIHNIFNHPLPQHPAVPSIPFSIGTISGMAPYLSILSPCAPCKSSVRMTAVCPFAAAKWRGVEPEPEEPTMGWVLVEWGWSE